MFAKLALKAAPVERQNVALLFGRHFQIEPVFKALEVDKAHTARAFARHNAWVLPRACRAPAVLALAVIGAITVFVLNRGRNSTLVIAICLLKVKANHLHRFP
jgi:hypothetical protein